MVRSQTTEAGQVYHNSHKDCSYKLLNQGNKAVARAHITQKPFICVNTSNGANYVHCNGNAGTGQPGQTHERDFWLF
ncbi:hypothetical protein HWI79_2849 [Cryptosporidium felis]|nr:hypothetical protein HWI79_2849 [Cryptosporidium felis]